MEKMPKNAKFFECIICDFKCCKQSNLNSHLLSLKHKNRTNPHFLEQKMLPEFSCTKCNKKYKARNSLWYHEQKCKNEIKPNITKENDNIQILSNLVLDIVKSNNNLQEQLIEMCKNNVYNSNNTIINTNNNTMIV